MRARAADDSVMRLFFAAVPDVAVHAALVGAAALPLALEARRVAPHNLHLTVAFIGAVEAVRLEELRRIADALNGEAFSLHLEAYEYWPEPEVVVAATRVIPVPLQQLWQRLHEALAARQWALEPKRLRPHVTLARKVAQAPVLPAMSPVDWTVREICLMRSEPVADGAAYTVVDTWSLLDKRKSL